MSRSRWLMVLGIGVISLLLAFFLRDVVYAVVIVPLAYLLWLVHFYYSAIPQLILWSVLLAVLFLVLLWNLIPDIPPARRKEPARRSPEGQVQALATWLAKARTGNYFKWQLANRLGRIARSLREGSGGRADLPSGGDAVDKYLDAGLNYSFVDFPTPRSPFQRRSRTPLDLDPKEVADYLESQMEKTSDRRG